LTLDVAKGVPSRNPAHDEAENWSSNINTGNGWEETE
jgi:hypothetical protein